MENRIHLFAIAGVVGMLVLVSVIIWLVVTRPAAVPLPATATFTPRPTVPTDTPTATNTPFEFVPPTKTPTATATGTPVPTNTPQDTATPPPTDTPRAAGPRPTSAPPRAPTSTQTPAPTAAPTSTGTPTPVPFPFAVSGGPVADPSRGCGGGGGYYVDGIVVDAQGRGLPNVRLRYQIALPGPHVIFDRTKVGTEAGRYQLYLGIQGNVVDISIVDENDNPLSMPATVSASGANCWWLLNWRRNF